MPAHITVVPASTVAGKATVRLLLASEETPVVRGIYRDPGKAPPEFTQNPRFQAAQGDVGAEDNLDFTGSDAVFYIPPPTYDGSETAVFASRAATNVWSAITRADIKRLVLHSALSAQNDHGIVGRVGETLRLALIMIFREFLNLITSPTRC